MITTPMQERKTIDLSREALLAPVFHQPSAI
jgi:hypothetical protein